MLSCAFTVVTLLLLCHHGLADAPIRLTGINSKLEGRVEIMYQGIWGTICDDGWDNIDATVVCRELGYVYGNATKNTRYGLSTGPVWLRQVACLGNESRLSHCMHTGAGNVGNCSHAQDVGVQCIANVRLVNGTTKYEGRVEVYHDGVWGTICDDEWDRNDAQVVCSELDLGHPITINSTIYRQGSGQIWLDDVDCVGNEQTIGNCSHRGWGSHNCNHRKDVGVKCNFVRLINGSTLYEGKVEVYYNDIWGAICSRRWRLNDAQVVCSQLGFGIATTAATSYVNLIYFWRNPWSCTGVERAITNCSHSGLTYAFDHCNFAASVRCSSVRLVNGPTKYEGRLEVSYNGEWGTVCEDKWDLDDAQVVCNELGLGKSLPAQHGMLYGQGSGEIWLSNVNCDGTEIAIGNCSHRGWGSHNCTHGGDVGVNCTAGYLVRLVGGSSYHEGRVEVNYNGEWGTVCDNGWDNTDARVVCRQLGFVSSRSAVGSADFGQGSGSIWLDSVACDGSELTLASCSHLGVGDTRNCSHSKDAGVICNFQRNSIRLVGGSSYNEGRVEVFYSGEWGTVCDDGWDDIDASVVCRQLGFGSSGIAIGSAGFGQGSKSIWLNNVACTGSESTLFSCGHVGINITSICYHYEDAGVKCNEDSKQGIAVRLARGNSLNEGIVEIKYNGEWGAVCGNEKENIDVVCKQLGFGSYGNYNDSDDYYSQGKGTIWINGLACTGTESTIASCGHFGVNISINDCYLYNLRKIRCFGMQGTAIRLAGGASYNQGRVEVNYNGEWGTVCDDGWDDTDAGVVCRQLGFGSSGTAVRSAGFGQGSGLILLDMVSCNGSEPILASCGHLGINVTRSCNHTKDAGVICSESQGIKVRLVGGSSQNEGRVEVNYNGEWGTVCDDGWDDTEAGVVCRQLGFGSSGIAIGSAGFGQGSGSIWLVNVTCVGSESTLASCGHPGVNITQFCNHSEDAGVKCTERQAPPHMYVHPLDKIIDIANGSTNIDFICMANGSRSYLWETDSGRNISSNAEGINSNHLILHNILPPDSGRYRCLATNQHGTTYSRYAMLTVKALPPVVSVLPSGKNQLTVGKRAEITCEATGVGILSFKYQWFLNNEPIAGQESQTLIVSSVSEESTGDYNCSVLNPYDVIGHSSNIFTLFLDQYCDPVKVDYNGFNIPWNKTFAGITVEAPCNGPGLRGTVSRRCIINDRWDEIVNCYRQKIGLLLDQAVSLSELNETEAIAEASEIADSLANITSSTEEPLFAVDIDLAVRILSVLNNFTETIAYNLTRDDPVLEGTASILNNLLNETNQDNWRQLEKNSPTTSQNFVTSAEQVTRLLSTTLTDNFTEAIKDKPNIVLKAEVISDESLDKGYVFPDKRDDLTTYTGGIAHVMVPGGLLQSLSVNSSKKLTIASTVIRNGTGFRLPSFNNGSATPRVLASPIFSLQINPLPDPIILQTNPIMMMFDVAISPDDPLLGESYQKSGIQYQQHFYALNKPDDVTCNFYNHSLITVILNQAVGWSTQGLSLDSNHLNKTSVTCLTTHLTSFAVLVSIQDERPPSSADKALSIISYIGCSISLLCLCISIILLSYTIFKLRDNINHLFNHLNLCIALALGLVVFITGIESATNNEFACKFVAALLQYLFISAFCWMLCEGVMLYMMLVTVFGNKLNRRGFFFILGWGPAIPIVAISVGIGHEHYGTNYYCWIESNDGAIMAFIVPIVVMMLINCVFLVIALKVLWTNRQKPDHENISINTSRAKDLLKAIIVLLPLLGLTWIIGILAVNNETQAFSWIFAILNSLQGVFIFIFHVLKNNQVAKEMEDQYQHMRGIKLFRRRFFTGSGSDSTNTLGNSAKEKKFPSKVSANSSGIGFAGGDYLARTLEMQPLEDQAEILEDSFEDKKQVKMTTYSKNEKESMVEGGDIRMKEKQPIRNDYDTDEDNKSITKDFKTSNTKGDEKEKKTAKNFNAEENATVAVEKNDAAAFTKPTPSLHAIK